MPDSQPPRRRILPAFPHPHFMGLAPLDVWCRVLGMARWRVGWRYWPRLAMALFSSAISTALTLPERLIVPGLLARRPHQIKVLVVLGYYRSGTTHLHYLLCCDKRLVTPRWNQALAPQGFVVSWAVLRFALIPFLAATRPQDDVAYGPEWPVEDDFAMCNAMGLDGGGSSLPGRFMFSESATVERFMRWHDLRTLSEDERAGFRRALRLFAEKIVRAEVLVRKFARSSSPTPVLLLKTPSHTARVRELLKVFGERNVQFVHLSREPGAVLRSNIAMHERLEPHRLQDEPSAESIRAGIIEEYARTERCFLEDEPLVPEGDLARLRFDELTGDPIGALKRVYTRLNIAWCDDAERRMRRYLDEVGEYRAGAARHAKNGPAAKEPLPEELAWMNEAFGHAGRTKSSPAQSAQPAVADAPSASAPKRSSCPLHRLAMHAGVLLTSVLLVATGLVLVGFLVQDRIDVLAWPAGIALGGLALRGVAERGGRGSRGLGVAAGVLTIALVLGLAMPVTWWEQYADRPGGWSGVPWPHVWKSAMRGVFAKSSLVWMGLGAVSAYRLASRRHAAPPGDEVEVL